MPSICYQLTYILYPSDIPNGCQIWVKYISYLLKYKYKYITFVQYKIKFNYSFWNNGKNKYKYKVLCQYKASTIMYIYKLGSRANWQMHANCMRSVSTSTNSTVRQLSLNVYMYMIRHDVRKYPLTLKLLVISNT